MSTPHVLVVDDEDDIRALIDEILSEEGYEVTVAENAAAARASRINRSFSILLLKVAGGKNLRAISRSNFLSFAL